MPFLVLKRNVNEKIVIGDDIEIMVTDAGFGWAKIGITAPRDVAVHRKEVSERIRGEAGERPSNMDGP